MDTVDAGQKEPAYKAQSQGSQEASAFFLLREWNPGITEIMPHSSFENPSKYFIQEPLLQSSLSKETSLSL